MIRESPPRASAHLAVVPSRGATAFSPRAVYEKLLERRIEDAYQAILAAKTREGRQSAFEEMARLCRQRTAERILQMEREQGLRA